MEKPFGGNPSAEASFFGLLVNKIGDRRELNAAAGNIVEERDLRIVDARGGSARHQISKGRMGFRFV